MENERNQCTKCGGQGEPSKALRNYHHVDKSYLRGEVEFETKLLDCIKCTSCGHSWIPEETTRQLALKWWCNLSPYDEQHSLREKYYGKERKTITLTGSEIEKIWLKETQDVPEIPVHLKSNQKQFKEVSPTLVKAYLDKFSQEGKAEILSILIKDLGVVNLVDPSLVITESKTT